MEKSPKYVVALVTAPNAKTARMLARTVLRERKAACVNLVPRIESHYWWNGNLERGSEVLMLIKTSEKHAPALEKLVLASHPYDTPEFVVLALSKGNKKYLAWIEKSVL